jgi:hypothetical protein
VKTMKKDQERRPERSAPHTGAWNAEASTPGGETDRVWVVQNGTADDAPPPPPAEGSGNRRNCLVWLLTGGLIAATLVGAVLMFIFLMSDRDQSQPVPEREQVALAPTLDPTDSLTPDPTASRTPRPTATRTSRPTRTPTPTPTPTVTPTPTPTPDVILQGIQALGELNTVQYSLKTVVEKDTRQEGLIQIGGIQIWRPRLNFLMVAGGRVKAGVDFGKLVRYDIVENTVVVYLPAPRITEYAVDPANIRMYYLYAGYGLDEEFVVETYNEALVEAQENLRRAALESDILDVARQNATALIQSLILGLGYSQVEVTFVPADDHQLPALEAPPMETFPTLQPFFTATPFG